MYPLTLTSIQAQNADLVVAQISEFLGEALGCDSEFLAELPWTRRLARLDEVDLAWMCGLPYVRRVDSGDRSLEPLVAAVMAGRRYQGRPIYYSDIVVNASSPYGAFEDLRGATWSYNEPNSQSGYNIVRYHLAVLGERKGFFGSVVEAGAHEASLRLILDGEIDASAIDSTVLEMEMERRPDELRGLRTIDTLGPSPIPPWVIRSSLPAKRKEEIRATFLEMHETPRGREVLRRGQIERFVPVTDTDYDPIREMARLAEDAVL